MKKLYRKGFTLIELLVVIAIIGILAAIVLVSLNTARSKARDTRRAADLSQIQLALEMNYDSKGAYPPQGVAGAIAYASATACPAIGVACAAADNLECLVACGYMPALPKDPGSTVYKYWTGNGRYILEATMETTASVLAGDLNDCTTIGSPVGCTCVDPIYCTGI